MTHQTLRLGKCWKLFWAILNDNIILTGAFVSPHVVGSYIPWNFCSNKISDSVLVAGVGLGNEVLVDWKFPWEVHILGGTVDIQDLAEVPEQIWLLNLWDALYKRTKANFELAVWLHPRKVSFIALRIFYYIDESVLLRTKPLVDSIRHFIRDPSGVFSVCHLCDCRIVQWHQVCLLHCT